MGVIELRFTGADKGESDFRGNYHVNRKDQQNRENASWHPSAIILLLSWQKVRRGW
jgi:hypothetical protein